jgi:hypothetical protein
MDHKHIEGFDDLPFEEKGKYFRGLLCHKHNIGLGHFNDSVEELQDAIDYVNFHNGKQFNVFNLSTDAYEI